MRPADDPAEEPADTSAAEADAGPVQHEPHEEVNRPSPLSGAVTLALAVGVALFVCWNVGTLVGSLSGQAIGDPETFGLDAAFPAGFVALLAPHLRSLDGKLAALLGATIALVLVPFVPVGLPILAAALAALVGLRPGARP